MVYADAELGDPALNFDIQCMAYKGHISNALLDLYEARQEDK